MRKLEKFWNDGLDDISTMEMQKKKKNFLYIKMKNKKV